ncbi:hypothetical protein [Azohydromonas aeria]|uniref:hypothetical protein n=1 Tax=Azohydromonas aeria TaxID=2590212 RepID=UPI0012F8F0DA|nr:hypothetical protein [Azohydromonas aeria]
MSAAACVPAHDYQTHFDRRGGACERAMRTQPGAQAAEFAQVLARAALASGMVVADVPAGGGYLSDVAEASAVACFLDGFVGRCNSTGHQGRFLGQHTLRALRETGWDTQSHEHVSFHWAFDDRAARDGFCRDLFDLCRCAPGEAARAAEAMLGTERLPDGRLGLRWQLMTIVARRLPACS